MVKLTEGIVLGRSRASDIETVRKLNCWGSDLTDISILRRMSSVQIVSLSVNGISTLSDFTHCHDLEELYIRKNNISQLSELCHLRKLPRLRVLWLADNPCAAAENYRMTVLKTLPNLDKLDNIAVSEDEVNRAIEEGADLLLPHQGDGDAELSTDYVTDAPDAGAAAGVTNGDAGAAASQATGVPSSEDARKVKHEKSSLSLEETNAIRAQLGLKPLPIEKLPQTAAVKRRDHNTHTAKARNANMLQAVLCLVKELDPESLEVVADAVRVRLEAL